MLQLGFDQFAQGGFVIVSEFIRFKLCGLALDQFLGERKLIWIHLARLQALEIFRGASQLSCEAQSISHDAGELFVSGRAHSDQPLSPAERNLSDADLACFLERLSDHSEGLSLRWVFRHHEVRLLKERGIEFVFVNELLNFNRMAGSDPDLFDLGRVQLDELSLAILVALYDVALFDRLLVCGRDVLMAHALAGPAIDLMKP